MIFPIALAYGVACSLTAARESEKRDNKLISQLSHDQFNREMLLRQTRALESIARQQPIINVKNSIF